MKKILIFIVIFFPLFTNATTFYISNKGNDFNSGINEQLSWKTLDKIQMEGNQGRIKAGDSVLFNKGEVYFGKIKWMNIWGMNCLSGTKENPIYFSSYGKGAKPIFIDNNIESIFPENRNVFHFAGVDNIIIDGLEFRDINKSGNKSLPGNCGVAIYFGAMYEATCNNCIVKNTDISGYGMGIVIIGNHNRITNCSLKDFVNLKSTPSDNDQFKYDDYGANAITITGNFNTIEKNFISGAWAESYDYGWNGGAIEFFNGSSFNKILNNYIIDCAGLAEFGGLSKNYISTKNYFEYNKIINCGSIIWSNISGNYGIKISNIYFTHNIVTENANSRYSGKNTGMGIVNKQIKKLIIPESVLFSHNGSHSEMVYSIKNNRFKVSNSLKILRENDCNSIQKYNILINK